MARRPQSMPPVLPGFSYLRPLGSGGFADVFLYEQDMPRRLVAVKVLTADAIDATARQRFVAEADTMARLSAHPSILTIFEASISADGRPYLATEYCPESFSERYKQAPLDVRTVLDAGVRMAGALESAHRSGVLHRDIKPSNMLATTLGHPVLADFGIATVMRPFAADEEVLAMSVPWSSPEVVGEGSPGTVASEVWSLGATLYTLLAGRTPFADPVREKNTREQMRARVVRAKYTPIRRPDLPQDVEYLLAQTMRREPERRPASMLELGEALRSLQAQLAHVPTALEVVGDQWVQATSVSIFAAEAPAPEVDLEPLGDAPATRGPVLSTVRPDSRRAARAATRGQRHEGTEEGLVSSRVRRGPSRGVLVGVGVALIVVAVGIVALAVSGVVG